MHLIQFNDRSRSASDPFYKVSKIPGNLATVKLGGELMQEIHHVRYCNELEKILYGINQNLIGFNFF